MLILNSFCLDKSYDIGMEGFRGPILHSHQFKDPKNYKDMNILIIGSSMAAHDIGAHCLKYGAHSLTFSCRSLLEGRK
jgi:trimethylamine monooxygenase